jgi:uncharacterized membrane protein
MSRARPTPLKAQMSERELTQVKDAKASEQLLRSIIENAQIGISLWGVTGLVTDPSTSEAGDESQL